MVSPVERLDANIPETNTPKSNETEVEVSKQHISETTTRVTEPASEILKTEPLATNVEQANTGTLISDTPKTANTRMPIDVKRPERKVSGLSLKSIQLKQKMQQELKAQEPDSQNLPTDPFKEETLIAAWKEYTTLVQKAGKHILFSHLSMGEPRIEGELIHLIFPNNTIKLEVEREQGDLLGFIKKKLNNYNIDLSIEVNEVVAKKYAYSTREKFEKLNEKNPSLDKLRQTFDLDL